MPLPRNGSKSLVYLPYMEHWRLLYLKISDGLNFYYLLNKYSKWKDGLA